MSHSAQQVPILWPLVVYFILDVVAISGIAILSHFLGQRRPRKKATNEIFESGVVTLGQARFRIPIHFYLLAMFFLVFDLESVFLFSWAVVAKDVGWVGFSEVSVFIVILLAALAYLWRIGALNWGPTSKLKHSEEPREEQQ